MTDTNQQTPTGTPSLQEILNPTPEQQAARDKASAEKFKNRTKLTRAEKREINRRNFWMAKGYKEPPQNTKRAAMGERNKAINLAMREETHVARIKLAELEKKFRAEDDTNASSKKKALTLYDETETSFAKAYAWVEREEARAARQEEVQAENRGEHQTVQTNNEAIRKAHMAEKKEADERAEQELLETSDAYADAIDTIGRAQRGEALIDITDAERAEIVASLKKHQEDQGIEYINPTEKRKRTIAEKERLAKEGKTLVVSKKRSAPDVVVPDFSKMLDSSECSL